tara:strand:- start:22039 stop:23079 length:1041 start_codon:yes stop_codon:yes gene_type:complete
VENQFLFFFSSLGAFNGLLLGLYFTFFNRKFQPNFFLGLVLFFLSVRVGSTMYFHFHEDRHLLKVFIQVALSSSLFIGPSLYIYLKSLKKSIPKKEAQWHLIPLLIIVLFIGLRYPYENYSILWRKHFVTIIYYQWLIYILLSGYVIRDVFRSLFMKENDFTIKNQWFIALFLGNLIIWIAHKTVLYTSYIFGGLSFSLVLYILLVFLLAKRKKADSLFKNQSKYLNKKIDESQTMMLSNRLENLMVKDHLYKEPNINLNSLAKKCSVLPHTLSQFLNENYGKSFSLFINEYRIEKAKELIISNKKLSIEAIGYDCGFNSKSAFFSTFKKLTGMTPANYRTKHFSS